MSSLSGRKKIASVSDIEGGWNSISQHTSTNGKVFYGSRKTAAIAVRGMLGGHLSLKTIMRYRPQEIVFTAKPTDLCGVCVQIKRLTKALDTLAGGCEPADPRVAMVKEKIDMLPFPRKHVS